MMAAKGNRESSWPKIHLAEVTPLFTVVLEDLEGPFMNENSMLNSNRSWRHMLRAEVTLAYDLHVHFSTSTETP